ncbi:purine nucleoside permease [Xylariomycetidae sp. FL0641]|nr:purine nucleoside permease [Xylariomycetidae sp. FL0641]
MKILRAGVLALGALLSSSLSNALGIAPTPKGTVHSTREEASSRLAPRVVIISMFLPEAEIWQRRLPSTGHGSLLAQNISVPGLSPLYPAVHCTATGSICQVVTGEAEINAAATVAAFAFASSASFDLSETYFLAAGIAGANPRRATVGAVALPRFAVQVALQHEVDARERPAGWRTGYFPQGARAPGDYPRSVYGTEVFEVSGGLDGLPLAASGQQYAKAMADPAVLACDVATSDVYYSGALLGEAFEDTVRVWTNQTAGTYCMTAQEDSAVLAVLTRAARAGLLDLGRAVVLRSGSNFDRPPPGVSAYEHLTQVGEHDGFDLAIENMYRAGIEIVDGILDGWHDTFEKGLAPTNYVGDILGTLGGTPDFGTGSVFDGFEDEAAPAKRNLGSRGGKGWK